MTSNPHWSIGDFYKKSWALTWNNKKLWVLGVAMMVFTQSGNSSYNSNSNREDSNQESFQVEAQTQKAPVVQNSEELNTLLQQDEELSDEELDLLFKQQEEILGPVGLAEQVMNPFAYPPFTSLKAGFDQVPIAIKGLLVLEIIAFLVGLIVLAVISSTWAETALIAGVLAATKNKLGSLAEVTRTSFTHLKPMIWLGVVPTLVFVLLCIIALIVFGIAFGIISNTVPLASILLVIGMIVFGVYAILRFVAALVWGGLYIVNDNLSGKEAFTRGNNLGKHTFWKVLRLGSVNVLVLLLLSIVPFIPALVMGVNELNKEAFEQASLIPAVVLFVAALPISSLITSVFYVFSFATFQYGFDSIRHLEEKE
jgi:hypothetical protein